MGFVEDAQVVWLDARLLEPGEGSLAAQGIDADDQTVAVRSSERVVRLGVRAADDAEVEAEKSPQFAFPVADQPRGRDDQDAADQPASQHLADVEPRHDGLAAAWLVGEQEAESGLGQHVVVDGDPLMRQRIDQRDLRGEGRVEQVPVAEPKRLCDDSNDLGIGAEIDRSGDNCVPLADQSGIAQKVPGQAVHGLCLS